MPVPTSCSERTIAAAGATLHVEQFLPDGSPRAVATFVHGFSQHCASYRHVARALAAAGLATLMFDCRGHGRSTGRRAYVNRFGEFLDDLDLAVAAARALAPGRPHVLIGHSHGGTVALDYTLSRRGPVDALVLAAPWIALKMHVPWFKRLLAPVASRLAPTLAMDSGLRSRDAARDPDVVTSLEADPLIHHVATSRWFSEVLATQTRLVAGAAALQTPTLMLVAGQDRIVSTQASLELARAAGPIVQVQTYAELFHEVFLEPERDTVISDVITWIHSQLSAQPAMAG